MIAIRNETDLVAVLLVVNQEADVRCDLPHAFLSKLTQRKVQIGQDLRIRSIEVVGLVPI
jgi:hypothetical protein